MTKRTSVGLQLMMWIAEFLIDRRDLDDKDVQELRHLRTRLGNTCNDLAR